MLPVPVDLALLEDALVASGRLSPLQVDNPERVRWAGAELAAELLADHLARVTRNAAAPEKLPSSTRCTAAPSRICPPAVSSVPPAGGIGPTTHANLRPRAKFSS
jgi:hypothetical protein